MLCRCESVSVLSCCMSSLGFSLACVCSLNNKYHKYIKPRNSAKKTELACTSANEAKHE